MVPAGFKATASGSDPTAIVAMTVLVAVLTTETVLSIFWDRRWVYSFLFVNTPAHRLFQVFAGSDASLDSTLTAFDKVNNIVFTKVGLLYVTLRPLIQFALSPGRFHTTEEQTHVCGHRTYPYSSLRQ